MAAIMLRGEDSTDRLSNLPHSILYLIVSFLDTKSAVQTSVLSRSWRCVWKHVPVLDLDFCSFGKDTSFKFFIERVLSLRYPLPLSKISYVDAVNSLEEDNSLCVQVMRYAVSRDVQHLAMNLSCDSFYSYGFSNLLDSLSGCNLKTLELSGFYMDSEFQSFRFQQMTTLELQGCALIPELCLTYEPFSNFPSLKTLVLDACPADSDNYDRFRISGEQLHCLKLARMDAHKMEIYAPKLKSFTLWDFVNKLKFTELTLPSLDHVDIRECDRLQVYETDKKDWVVWFQGLHNVKSLTLNDRILERLGRISKFLEQLHSPFKRLEKLIIWCNNSPHKVVDSDNIPYQVVNYFLKGSVATNPSIKILLE